jgi:hypothetical protein
MSDRDYPTEEELQRIREWPSTDLEGLMAFVRSIWWAADALWKAEAGKVFISTGGWSGNEELIGAMRENVAVSALCWQSSHRGGYFEFELPVPTRPEASHVVE